MQKILKFLAVCSVLIFAASHSLYAQKQGQAKIDSLMLELPKAKDDTNKVKLLNDLSIGYLQTNTDDAIRYEQLCLDLAKTLKWNLGIAIACNRFGIIYQQKADYPKSLSYLSESLKLFEDLNEKNRVIKLEGNIAQVYINLSNYPAALESLFKALKSAEELDNKASMADTYYKLAMAYYYQANYPNALENGLKALHLNENIGDQGSVCSTLNVIGSIYYNSKDYDNALSYFTKSLNIAVDLKNNRAKLIAIGNIGNIYKKQKDYNKAIEYYFKSLDMAQEIGEKSGIIISNTTIGNTYYKLHNYTSAVAYHFVALKISEEIKDKNNATICYNAIAIDFVMMLTDTSKEITLQSLPAARNIPFKTDSLIPKGKTAILRKAIEYLNKAIVIEKEINTLNRLMESYDGLQAADSLLGDFKSAYEAKSAYIIYKDSIFNKENDKKIMQQQMTYDYDKKEALAKAEQDKKDAVQRNVRNSILAGMAGLLVFATVVFRQRNRISKEKKRSEDLLLNILPAEVAEELKAKGAAESKMIDEVTVLFTDFKGFTMLSEKLTPRELVAQINECFSAFDHIMDKYGVEKIKTIGDSYMAAGGLPTPNKTHPEDVVMAALDIQQYMLAHKQRKEAAGELYFEIRIGIHTGPVVAGIVGVKKFAYDIWGDTVNTASRMESSGEVGKVNISGATHELVKNKFNCTYRGEVQAKNKGMMQMYFVNGGV